VRHIIVPALAVALLAVPAAAFADDSNVQSLITQLKPHKPVTRGLPKPGAAPAAAEPAAAQPVTPAAAAAPMHAARPAPAPVAAAAPEAPAADLNVLFASGSADLTPAAVRTLDDLGRALSDASMGESHFLIEGHTDTVGSRADNQALSDRRAAAVVQFLVTHFHIAADRLQSKGVGEDAPLVPTADQVAEPRNRRVHVVNLDG
jgi:outer membrane protein OmpA-like peptidoglycan-associated protein